MASFKFTDKRENAKPTFRDLRIGDPFTSLNGRVIFVKTEVVYDEHKNPYNTISFDGEFYWSDDDEEIAPVQEIEIIIKR